MSTDNNMTEEDYKELGKHVKTFDPLSFSTQMEEGLSLNNSLSLSSSLNLPEDTSLKPTYSALPSLEELNNNNKKFVDDFFNRQNTELQDKESLDVEKFKPKATQRFEQAMKDVSYIASITKNENDFINLMRNKDSFEPRYDKELTERAQKESISKDKLVKHLEVSRGIYNYKMEQSLNLSLGGDSNPDTKSSEATIQKMAELLSKAELKELERNSNYSEQIVKRDSYTNETLNEQASKRQRTI